MFYNFFNYFFLESFHVNGKKFDLIEINKPETNYVILEILKKDSDEVKGKIY